MKTDKRIEDVLLEDCIALWKSGYHISRSSLQRKFKIGYVRAGKLLDEINRLPSGLAIDKTTLK